MVVVLAYGAGIVAWSLGAPLHVALGVGCLAFAGLLVVVEAGLALWSIVQRWAAGEADDTVLRFDDDARRRLEAQRARALRIRAIQRGEESGRLPPVA